MVTAATLVILASMIAEGALAVRNDAALRARGAVEPPGDVYRIMQVAYPGGFLAMLAEGAARGAGQGSGFWIGAAIFAAGKALKYWAIATLGPRWTFRVLVPPEGERIRRGPYRWLAHPNYVGVLGELLGVAIAMHALVTGPLAVAGFSFLMLRRIVVEEAALRGQSRMQAGDGRASAANEPAERSERPSARE